MQKVLDLLSKFRKTVAHKINEWLEWLQMMKLRRVEISRDDWKEKARIRADELRENRKTRRADRVRIQSQSEEIRRLKAELKKKSKAPPKG
jgi:hypothetical protein